MEEKKLRELAVKLAARIQAHDAVVPAKTCQCPMPCQAANDADEAIPATVLPLRRDRA
jgi:hypothetical protein